jgi:hypothetical protein
MLRFCFDDVFALVILINGFKTSQFLLPGYHRVQLLEDEGKGSQNHFGTKNPSVAESLRD